MVNGIFASYFVCRHIFAVLASEAVVRRREVLCLVLYRGLTTSHAEALDDDSRILLRSTAVQIAIPGLGKM